MIFIDENGDPAGMRLRKAPAMHAVPLKDGSGYFVRVTWPSGAEEQVDPFASEAEAEQWIADSAAWVAGHPRTRSA